MGCFHSTNSQENDTTRSMERTVFVANMNFTPIMAERGPLYVAALVLRMRQLCGPLLRKYGVKVLSAHAGQFMCVFGEPGQAVSAALEIRRLLVQSRDHCSVMDDILLLISGFGIDCGINIVEDPWGTPVGVAVDTAILLSQRIAENVDVLVSGRVSRKLADSNALEHLILSKEVFLDTGWLPLTYYKVGGDLREYKVASAEEWLSALTLNHKHMSEFEIGVSTWLELVCLVEQAAKTKVLSPNPEGTNSAGKARMLSPILEEGNSALEKDSRGVAEPGASEKGSTAGLGDPEEEQADPVAESNGSRNGTTVQSLSEGEESTVVEIRPSEVSTGTVHELGGRLVMGGEEEEGRDVNANAVVSGPAGKYVQRQPDEEEGGTNEVEKVLDVEEEKAECVEGKGVDCGQKESLETPVAEANVTCGLEIDEKRRNYRQFLNLSRQLHNDYVIEDACCLVCRFVWEDTTRLYGPNHRLRVEELAKSLMRETCDKWHGRLVECGLCIFTDSSDALAASVEARLAIDEHNAMQDDESNFIPLRGVGVDIGEVVFVSKTDVHWGPPVTAASMLADDAARQGDLLITDEVFEATKMNARFRELVYTWRDLEFTRAHIMVEGAWSVSGNLFDVEALYT